VSDPGLDERLKAAEQIERSTRFMLFGIAGIAFVAVIDLPTAWLTGDRRIDVALLASAAMALWGVYSMRRLAGRLRANQPPPRPSGINRVFSVAGMAAALALSAAIGYLLGGWIVAVLLPAASIIFMAAAAAVALGRRRTSIRR
jgi:hypothetical protein